MGIRISKDHLHPSVIESITSLIGDLNQLETTAKGNAVEAINELLANGGNKEELEALIAEITEGKELIANAVGEPLTAEESFDEMSNDINSLLSQFKTNMMNNGITVESGDKFKQLIDKIATMVEEGSGKGIQFAEGNLGGFEALFNTNKTYFYEKIFNYNLSFTPTILILDFQKIDDITNLKYYFSINNISNNSVENSADIYKDQSRSAGFFRFFITDITNTSFKLNYNFVYDMKADIQNVKYYAIGVGEEDTTLRDSLASILQGEGVSVTEEDDMASLIIKVDEEFDNKENEIDKIKPFSFISNIIASSYDGITFFILKDNGELIAGPSYFGASTGYGDNENTDKVMVVESDVKKILYTGTNCTFIMKNDGSVWACGANRGYQLGIGTSDETTKFTKVNATGIIHVNNLGDTTIIVKNDGTVWGCGNTLILFNCNALVGGDAGTLDETFRQLNINNVKEVFQISDYGLYAIFALKNDNTLWVIGSYNGGTYSTFTKIMDL